MKRQFLAGALILTITGFASVAHATLDGLLSSLSVQAKADLNGFMVKLGAQFGVPVPKVHEIMQTVKAPEDAFMVLQVGQMTKKPPEVVVETYKKSKGKGWGVIAQELGIKPGSSEFHALKNGNLSFTGRPGGAHDKGPEGAKGKEKGKEKGHGRK